MSKIVIREHNAGMWVALDECDVGILTDEDYDKWARRGFDQDEIVLTGGDCTLEHPITLLPAKHVVHGEA